MYVSLLQHLFTRAGASVSPGLNETGLFCMHGVGPSWDIFDWGDSGNGGCDEGSNTPAAPTVNLPQILHTEFHVNFRVHVSTSLHSFIRAFVDN
jgi:hypothetical protein